MTSFMAKVVLVDIEGTTTSISFVKDVLFPYAKDHCKSFVEKTWTTDSTRNIVDDLKNLPQYAEFCAKGDNIDKKSNIEMITEFVIYLINLDLKLKPLKTLQGLIWENGYENGELIGHIYDDVPKTLKNWQAKGLKIAVYSSGSVKAQQLLFGKTKFGNLLPYFSEHFDTTSGMKVDPTSYLNIANILGVEPKNVLFFTDVVKEAAAAEFAGMQVIILNRPGNSPLTPEEQATYTIVNSFEEVNINLAT